MPQKVTDHRIIRQNSKRFQKRVQSFFSELDFNVKREVILQNGVNFPKHRPYEVWDKINTYGNIHSDKFTIKTKTTQGQSQIQIKKSDLQKVSSIATNQQKLPILTFCFLNDSEIYAIIPLKQWKKFSHDGQSRLDV